MDKEQTNRLVSDVTRAFAQMGNDRSEELYHAQIGPIVNGLSLGDRSELAAALRQKEALGDEAHLLTGLVYYINPPVGGS